jgi:hypothetical protein
MGRAKILKSIPTKSEHLTETIVGNMLKKVKQYKELPFYEQEVSPEVWEKYQILRGT